MRQDADNKTGSGYRKIITEGFKAVWPICVGYVPLGLAFGILAEKAGLSPLQTCFMSLGVFAGSGQFIAVSMLSSGAGILSIVLTTFMVNLRHLLMSSSLAVFLNGVSRLKVSVLSYGIVDETFAVNLGKFKTRDWGVNRAIAASYFAFFSWVLSTTAGSYCGRFISAHAFGIDYALIAMFICLLVFQLGGTIYFITAAIAGIAGVVVSVILPGNAYIVIATVLAATTGYFIRKFKVL